MALVLADRVQETTTTTGTGTITLAGAVSGYQSFSAIGNGNTTYYTITSGTAWEVGIGTYTSSGTTLARTTILSSSAAGAAITLAGTSNVFATYPAEKSVNLDASGNATALGTPASGTVTNLTGTASININGTVGATTATTGAFTTLSASSTVSGTGFSTYLASPPAIGGTAAAAGSFTTLSASSTVSGTGFSTYLASPPAIGGTAAAAGAFTTLSASSTVSGTGFSTYLASPPAIGGTAAAAGAFTTLSASSTVSGTGFSTYLASPPAIGGTAAAAGSFTTLSGSTSLTSPLVIGGSTASSTLTVQSTSGAGTTDAIIFKSGSQVEQFRILTGGGITSAALVDAVGYKGLPQNSQTASYTLALTDMGKMINITTGGVVIPGNISVAFPVGSTVIVYNNSASSQTISISSDTLYLAGTATTGSRTLAQRGLATLVKVATTTWVASGAGVT